MRRAGLRVTHVAWHQGESDAGVTTGDAYVADFRALVASLRDEGVQAPVYAAVATICRSQGDPGLRAAQRSLPGRIAGVRPGPDTDALGAGPDRHDGCHFSETGQAAHARLWREALLAPTPVP